MKKSKGLGVALAAGLMAMGGVTTTVAPQAVNELSQQEKSMPPSKVKEVKVVPNRRTGGTRMWRGEGVSPKVYGMARQNARRQNWVRKGGVRGGYVKGMRSMSRSLYL